MGSEADEYKVGYKRPPVAHQFKKGQSGNPKGRKPSKKEHVELNFDNERQFTASVKGRSVQLSAREAALRTQVQRAINKRDWKAAAFLLERMEHHKLIQPPKTQYGGVLNIPLSLADSTDAK